MSMVYSYVSKCMYLPIFVDQNVRIKINKNVTNKNKIKCEIRLSTNNSIVVLDPSTRKLLSS